MSRFYTRRNILLLASGGLAGLALSACGGSAATSPVASTSSSAPAATASAPTTPATSSASISSAASSSAGVQTSAATSSAASSSAAAATTSSQAVARVAAAAGGTTIQWWDYNPTPDKLANDFLAKQWSPDHPNLGIEIVTHAGNNIQAEEQLTVLLAGGTPPDLCDVPMSENDLPSRGLSQPIDDLVSRDKYDLSRFNKSHIEDLAKYLGKLYSIPYSTGGNGYAMVYNRNMLAQAGIAEPSAKWEEAWSWPDFRDNLRRLTKGTGQQTTQAGLGDYGYYILTIPIPYKADWITPDLKTIICDSPEMIQAYSDYLDLVLKDHTTEASPGVKLDSSGPTGAFGAGQTAIATIGSWQLGDYAKLTKVDWAFMPTPKASVASPEFGPVFLGIAKGAKHRDQAWELLKWLVDQGRYARYLGRPGATKVDTEPMLRDQFQNLPNVRWQVLLDEYDIAQPLPFIRRQPSWGPMSKLTDAAWKDLSQGKQDVPTALKNLKTALQGIVDEYEKNKPAG